MPSEMPAANIRAFTREYTPHQPLPSGTLIRCQQVTNIRRQEKKNDESPICLEGGMARKMRDEPFYVADQGTKEVGSHRHLDQPRAAQPQPNAAGDNRADRNTSCPHRCPSRDSQRVPIKPLWAPLRTRASTPPPPLQGAHYEGGALQSRSAWHAGAGGHTGHGRTWQGMGDIPRTKSGVPLLPIIMSEQACACT